MTIPKINDSIENLPDIFFYIFFDNKRVAFQRVSARDFMTNRRFCCLKMLPDVYNKSNSNIFKGGLLKFSMRIYDNSVSKNYFKFYLKIKKIRETPKTRKSGRKA